MLSRYKLDNKGQHLAEMAILLALVAAVFIGMQFYLQRSMQGRYKAGVDFVLHDKIGLTKLQYEPYYRESKTTETSNKILEKKLGKNYETQDTSTDTKGQVRIDGTKYAD